MGRRKRMLDDGDSSDSSNADSYGGDLDGNDDPDARDEQALFENPYKRKRTNGKEAALYGIFAEDEEEDEKTSARASKSARHRRDWAKAPSFVKTEQKVDLDAELEMDVDDEEEEEVNGSDDDDDEGEDEGGGRGNLPDPPDLSRLESPPIQSEEVDAHRRGGIGTSRGGIGSSQGGIGSSKGGIGSSGGGIGSSKGGIGSSGGGIGSWKGGIGSSKGGIGASASFTSGPSLNTSAPISSPVPNKDPPSFSGRGLGSRSTPTSALTPDSTPSAFGMRQSNSFTRSTAASPKPAVALSTSEQQHFNKISGTFGARMLAKMGWEVGTGLGATGEGIVTPVESKLRPQRAGIAFRFKEKTEQSRAEARRQALRRGEVVSEDEDDPNVKKQKKKARAVAEKRSEAWKKPKKVKTKVEHKTYEQIVAEAGVELPSAGVGQIIDATGAVPREISSLSEINLNSWAPSNDPTRVPEVRHNVQLITDACKHDLDGLAREGKALEERKRYVLAEDARLRKRVEDEAQLIAQLQRVQLVANEISVLSKELASVYEVSLDPLSPLFYRLINEFPNEIQRYHLDEIVVAAIAPLFRRMVSQWEPLTDPTAFISTLRNWRPVLRLESREVKPQTEVDIYGSKTTPTPSVDDIVKPMTPFESLLWNVWLPKVRTAINNEWSPKSPHSAVKLYEVWSTFLPAFIRDNLLDQLVLPKVQKAVADWNSKLDTASLQSIVFPWLPHVGLRLEDVLGDARRKIKSLLRSWSANDDAPTDLRAWKDMFDVGEWDNLLLKYVVPKLGASLRTDFRINPRKQEMGPFGRALQWSDLLRSSVFSQLLETEFFPKWLDALHIWLIQPNVNLSEVADWSEFWKKEAFPESVLALPGVSRGFTRGYQLMNKAMELGPDAPTKLPRPDFRGEQAQSSPRKENTKTPSRPSARTHEITFKSIVEEYVASHNLLMMPAGQAHEKSRMPLFRVNQSGEPKGGILVYIQDDAVWASLEGAGGPTVEYRAIALDDLVARALS